MTLVRCSSAPHTTSTQPWPGDLLWVNGVPVTAAAELPSDAYDLTDTSCSASR